MAVNKLGAVGAVELDISKFFDTGLLQKLKPYGISGQIFGHISSFLSNRQLWVVLDERFSQEYLEFLKGPFFVLHFPNIH